MENVELSLEDIEPPERIPDLPAAVGRVLRHHGASGWDIAIVLCSDTFIHDLNRTYRDKDEPTDVLTFTANDDPVEGDIVVSLETVARNSAEYSVPLDEELIRVAVHGALHLAGYSHEGVSLGDPAASEHPMLQTQENLVKWIMEEQ